MGKHLNQKHDKHEKYTISPYYTIYWNCSFSK